MSKLSTYPLRLPKSLKDKVDKDDQTSINQFITIAVAEKISALDTEAFFTEKKRAQIWMLLNVFYSVRVVKHLVKVM